MKYYIIAGEASGDLHASKLMRGLHAADPACDIRFWGGDAMAASGGTLVRHYRDVAMMGVTDVFLNARRVLDRIASCRRDLLAWRPDAVILVDSPGFNLRIARFARRQGFKVFWYIAPKVWAHGASRVKKLRRDVDVLYCIFPFELAWFRARGLEPRYFGNPLFDSLAAWSFRPLDGKEERRIALLAGSRRSELKFLMPRFVELEKRLASDPQLAPFRLTLAAAPSLPVAEYRRYLPASSRIEVVAGRTYDVLAASQAAVINSGTASLEAALIGTPQLVCYGFDRITWLAAKLLVKVPYISLVNLTLDRLIFPELVQDAASPEAMAAALKQILTDGHTAARMKRDYEELKGVLGGVGASGRVAKDIFHEIAHL